MTTVDKKMKKNVFAVTNRYKYGSEEADRRVKQLGYCRVHMPSIPRTGSTWFRAMFETATSQPTFSMWPGRHSLLNVSHAIMSVCV